MLIHVEAMKVAKYTSGVTDLPELSDILVTAAWHELHPRRGTSRMNNKHPARIVIKQMKKGLISSTNSALKIIPHWWLCKLRFETQRGFMARSSQVAADQEATWHSDLEELSHLVSSSFGK